MTKLCVASWNGDSVLVDVLLKRAYTDINFADPERGWTAIHMSSFKGHYSVTKLLLDNLFIDPDVVDKDGKTPLHLAHLAGHDAIVSMLSGDKRVRSIHSDLMPSHSYSRVIVMDVTVSQPLMHNYAPDWNTQYLLHHASSKGDTAIVQLIMSSPLGTSPADGSMNPFFGDALLVASANGHDEIVALLLQVVDPNFQDVNGRTALHIASASNHPIIVSTLLSSATLDANKADCNGTTALHIATNLGNIDVLRVMLENERVDPNAQLPVRFVIIDCFLDNNCELRME